MSATYQFPRPALAVDCVVFGLDEAGLQVLLVQRDLPPFKGRWALPGGLVRSDENLEEAARRELAEETGHAAAVLEPLGSQWLFPSFAGARAHFFLARDVRPAGAPHPDEFETIEVRAVPLAELRADGESPAPRHLTDVCSRLGVALALARLDGGPGGRSGARA